MKVEENKEILRVLFIGDIVGKPGRKAVEAVLPKLVQDCGADFVIANCENAAGGRGVTTRIVNFLFGCGIHVLTSGNHIWDNKDIIPYFENAAGNSRLLRPANFPEMNPGTGYGVYESDNGKLGVVNICGTLFMEGYNHPFFTAERLANELREITRTIIIDFHAEATSEKLALGWYLDGRVSAVIGTHTHVQTADERVLPQGTAYITDAGMSGLWIR